jgi:protein TonB
VIPEYPEIARKAGIEGKVFTKLLVNQQGRVDSVAVLKGPEVFIDATVKAAGQLRFKPARQNDKPVRVWVSQVFVFRLK